MNLIRDRLYVFFMNLAYWVATPTVKEIHTKVIDQGIRDVHAELDSRISRGFE